VDPTLPRDGTDLIATASRDAQRLTRRYPRDGTDLMTLSSVQGVRRLGS